TAAPRPARSRTPRRGSPPPCPPASSHHPTPATGGARRHPPPIITPLRSTPTPGVSSIHAAHRAYLPHPFPPPMTPPDRAAPPPDVSPPALSRRRRTDSREFALQVAPGRRNVDGEADTDVVQLQVLYQGRPLPPADLGLASPACLNVWSYLCNKLTEAVVD